MKTEAASTHDALARCPISVLTGHQYEHTVLSSAYCYQNLRRRLVSEYKVSTSYSDIKLGTRPLCAHVAC